MWMRVLIGKEKLGQSRSRYAATAGGTHPDEIPAPERIQFTGHERFSLSYLTLSMLVHTVHGQHNNKSNTRYGRKVFSTMQNSCVAASISLVP
jgi:hypothetical protein